VRAVRIAIPPALHSYSGGRSAVEVMLPADARLAEAIAAVEARFPGLRFRIIDEQDRIRPHIKLFVGIDAAPGLDTALGGEREVHIICALSGG